MPAYLAVLYTKPDRWTNVSREEMRRIMLEYRPWREALEARGHFLHGHKLADGTGRVLRGRQKVKVIDGPFSESKEVVGGYIALRASGYDEAIELLLDCPHLRYDGTIEVREIEEPPR